MADIFLSYSSEDKKKATRIVELLERAGFSVWWDQNIEGGKNFSKEIEIEINRAKAVIVLWSHNSYESHWVADEANAGLREEKLVPICIDDIEPPMGFRQLQTINLSTWKSRHDDALFQDVIVAISAIVRKETPTNDLQHYRAAGTAVQVRSIVGSNSVVMGMIGLVVLVGVISFFWWRQIPNPPDDTELAQSIAVLPFKNLSDDPDQSFFADGLTEEILNLLAQVPELKVAGRTSSFAFKNKDGDLRVIGATLGVTRVLEGSVRKSGNRLRITAQLVNVEDGFHLWSNTYDRDLREVFSIQDEIAANILSTLKVKMSVAAPSRGLPTEDMDAYAFFLKGNTSMSAHTAPEFVKARRYYRQAVELDATFGEAWEGLAQVTLLLGVFAEEARVEAVGYLENALAANPDLALSAIVLKEFDLAAGDFDKSIAGILRLYKRILDVQPHDFVTRQGYHDNLLGMGHFQWALDLVNEGLALDPMISIYHLDRASSLLALGREKESYEAAKLFGERSGYPVLPNWFALRALVRGDETAAHRYVADYAALSGADPNDVLSFLKRLVDRQTRPATLTDPQIALLFGPQAFGRANTNVEITIRYLLRDEEFWPSFEAMLATAERPSAQALSLLLFADAWYYNDPRFRQVMEERRTIVEYWRNYQKPDFCDGTNTSWICELEPS